MPNEIVKLGISPDGKEFEEKVLSAASVISSSGASAEMHMESTGIHMTAAEKTKLASMQTDAQANVIDQIRRNGVPLSVNNKMVDIAVPTKTSELINDDWFLTANSMLSATKISGVLPVTSIPPAAVEKLTIVATDATRYALTAATVQNGDTVKVTATGRMYYIKDETQLASANGYEEYTAGSASTVPWGGVTGKPTTVSGYGITDGATNASVDQKIAGEATARTNADSALDALIKSESDAINTRITTIKNQQDAAIAVKDTVFAASESAIATSGVRAGGLVLVQV